MVGDRCWQAVMVKDTRFLGAGIPGPPYSNNIYDLGIKFTMTGFLSDTQRTLLRLGGGAVLALLGGGFIRSRM